MKILLILLAFFLAGCEATDEPKIEACRVAGNGWGIRIYCIEGFKFVALIGGGFGGITQFFGADGKPVRCSCRGKSDE